MRRALMLLIVGWILFGGLPVVAQTTDLPNTYMLESGATANYPAGWLVRTYENGRDYLASNDSIVNLFDPPLLEERHGGTTTDMIEMMTLFFPGWDYTENLTFNAADVQMTTLGDRAFGIYDFDDAYGDQAILIGVPFNDGNIGILVGLTFGGELTERDQILAIAQTFDYPGKASIEDAVQGATANDGAFSFADGTSLSFDASVWRVEEALDDKLNIISSENQMVLTLYDEETIIEAGINTLEDLMAYDFESLNLSEFYDPNGVTPFRVAERDGLRYDYIATLEDGTQFEVLVILVPMENGNVVRMRAVPLQTLQVGNLREIVTVLDSIIAEDVPIMVLGDGPFPQQHDFDTESFILSLFYPADWEKVVQEDDGFTFFQSDATRWVPGWFSPTAQEERGFTVGNLTDSISGVFNPADDALVFDPDNVKIQKIDGREVARYDYVDTDDVSSFTNTIMAMNMGDNYIFLVHFFPRTGEHTQEVQTVLDMFLSATITFK